LLFSSKKNGKLIKELHISHTSILFKSCVEYVNKNMFKIKVVIAFNKNSLKYEPTEKWHLERYRSFEV
jgi:hypothetical protein